MRMPCLKWIEIHSAVSVDWGARAEGSDGSWHTDAKICDFSPVTTKWPLLVTGGSMIVPVVLRVTTLLEAATCTVQSVESMNSPMKMLLLLAPGPSARMP